MPRGWVCVSVSVSTSFSDRLSTSVPLHLSSLSLHPLIHSNSRLVRFKVWTPSQVQAPSLCQRKLYTWLQLHRVGGGNIPVPILPVRPPRCHTQPQILYLWDRAVARAPPPRFRTIVCAGRRVDVSAVCWFSLRVQGEYKKVLGRHPRGFSHSQRHLSHGFKGARRIFLSGVSLHL